jgi:hypothetical protein
MNVAFNLRLVFTFLDFRCDRPIQPDRTLRGFDRGVGEWGDRLQHHYTTAVTQAQLSSKTLLL